MKNELTNKPVIALDLGGTVIKLGLVRNGQILAEMQLDSQAHSGLAARLPEITGQINTLLSLSGIPLTDVAGIGMALPGIIDTIAGKVMSINAKYIDAPDLDLPGWALREWNLPLRMENDSRAALLGECRYGSGVGYDNAVLMMLGTGIGTAAMIEGNVLRGRHYQAGILGGHFIINHKGSSCNCGTIGCAEAEASTWDLSRRLAGDSRLENSLLQSASRLDFKAVFSNAGQGDELATEVRDQCMHVWAACALNLVRAYDPDVLIAGGGIMASGHLILPHIRRILEKDTWSTWGKVEVVQAALPHTAALLGVSTLFH